MIFKKHRLLVFLGLILIILASACSNEAKVEPKKTDEVKLTTDENKVYIGFVLDTLQQERWYKDKELFEEKITELGGNVKTLAANGSESVQLAQAKLLIEEGVDVLVVVPYNADAAAEIVELAHKANTKVISYDRLIKNADVDYYISFDNLKVGELQANEVLKHTTNGNFAYIGGAETDNNAVLFREGAMKVLQPQIDQGKINLVYDKYTDNWDPAIAEKNMLEALEQTSGEIDAVISANDGNAGGVVKALATNGLDGNIPVSGQDAELDAVKRIVAGKQTMTVYKPINLLAETAAEMAMKVAQNEEIETNNAVNNGKIDVPSYLLEPETVTKENIDSTIIKDNYLTQEEIYGN
ncbi:sugar ABC transporter substrate-binding protein [Aquibacillus rhizosphaerae]|uniref:Sugar ABC transporter substrate-binding protein n=1 Tax=Aquibacillus rhizosphaerae TaxID=3051431 RepID=A0ABT7L050_9BACI|nr:substrate-binding domain-containing protein [Aquibacillus sp. LR5S19]MDL4839117.1 sugar ABC transporter substrate-binding protein [Aquibacillus sp. LR5S19]